VLKGDHVTNLGQEK